MSHCGAKCFYSQNTTNTGVKRVEAILPWLERSARQSIMKPLLNRATSFLMRKRIIDGEDTGILTKPRSRLHSDNIWTNLKLQSSPRGGHGFTSDRVVTSGGTGQSARALRAMTSRTVVHYRTAWAYRSCSPAQTSELYGLLPVKIGVKRRY